MSRLQFLLAAVLVVLFGVGLLGAVTGQNPACVLNSTRGDQYDFNTLFSQDFTSNGNLNNDTCTYTYNLCGTSNICAAGVLACQYNCPSNFPAPGRVLAYSSSLTLSFINASAPQLGVVAQAQAFTGTQECNRNVNLLFACGPSLPTPTFTQIESASPSTGICLHNFITPTTLLCQYNKQ